MSNLQIIILAGGESTRFSPLKKKDLYHFNGEIIPLIQYREYSKLKPSKIFIIVSSNTIDDYNKIFADYSDVEIVVQSGDKGMASAVEAVIHKIDVNNPTIIVNMDDFYQDYDAIFTKFTSVYSSLLENNESALMGNYMEGYFPGGYLVVEDGYITDIVEKPGEGNEPSKYVNSVFDFFPNPQILFEYLLKASSQKDDVFEVALSMMMKNGNKFRLLNNEEQWLTIKYPWHTINVMNMYLRMIKGQKIAKDVYIAPTAIINGDVIIESGTKIYDGAVINGPVFIGKNCVIANNALVRDSMIGDGCVVGYVTEIARSYLRSNVWTHKNYIGDSIIDDNVSFGSNAVTANLRLDEKNVLINVKGQKVDTNLNKLGAIIGPNVRIGVSTMIMPGVKIGGNCMIGSGVLINEDIEEGKFISLKQELQIKENNIDIEGINREKFKHKL
jgi:bifunctional UDP-N-acetylglucosamine pyrophosphorylase/glucosamine-1-phosphate N-acetyltransferase